MQMHPTKSLARTRRHTHIRIQTHTITCTLNVTVWGVRWSRTSVHGDDDGLSMAESRWRSDTCDATLGVHTSAPCTHTHTHAHSCTRAGTNTTRTAGARLVECPRFGIEGERGAVGRIAGYYFGWIVVLQKASARMKNRNDKFPLTAQPRIPEIE